MGQLEVRYCEEGLDNPYVVFQEKNDAECANFADLYKGLATDLAVQLVHDDVMSDEIIGGREIEVNNE